MPDRIDLHVEAPRVAREALRLDTPPGGEASAAVTAPVAYRVLDRHKAA